MMFLADFSVIKPTIGLLVWTSVIFLLFWFIIGKFAFGPIKDALKKREGDIQKALDEAKMARQEMANLKAKNEDLLIQAREERAGILKEAKEAAANFEAEQREKTKDKMQNLIADAKNEINNMKMEAITDLKNQTGKIAIEIAEKVLRKNLAGDNDQTEFVGKLVDEIKLN